MLPLHVGARILGDWLDDWSALARLDLAFCNHLQRPEFLELMRSSTFPSSPDPDPDRKQGVEFLRWIVSRGVKFKSLSCSLFHPANQKNALTIMDSLFSNTGKEVTKIKITDVPGFWVMPDNDEDEDDVEWTFQYPNFLVNFWVNIVQHCPKLTHFSAHHTAGFLCVLRNCPKLEAVNVRDCACFDMQAMQEMLQRTPALKELKVCRTKVCDKALMELATARPLLTKLHCTGCHAVTLHGVLAVVEQCGNLEELCTDYMDKSVLAKIAECCPNFKSLRTRSEHITDTVLLALLERCKLEVLDIEGHKITSESLHKLNNMKMIVIWKAVTMNDADVQIMAEHNPSLRHLELQRCPNITKNSFYQLISRCPLLEICASSKGQMNVECNYLQGIRL